MKGRTATLLGALLLAAAGGYWLGRQRAAPPVAAHRATASSASPTVLYWYDPMVPEQHFDKPGLSPMGMQMVPKYAPNTATAAGGVAVDAATVGNLGVRVAPVQRRVLEEVWQSPGTVTWNLRRTITVSARTDAVITHLHVRAPYTPVANGAPLADILAPAWNSALAEAEALQHAQSTDAQSLREAAQQHLTVLGLRAADIASPRAPDGSITLHASQAGIVTSLEVREGQRVVAGQSLMTLSDLSSVWVEAGVPQSRAGELAPGTPVQVHSDALPGVQIAAQLEALLPDIDRETRTQRARIVLPNPGGRLSPGQFVQVEFRSGGGSPVLSVPADAVITAGDAPKVILALGGGHFQPVNVTTGRGAAGNTEILSGLHGDEQVVVSAQFLIDSEASLTGAMDRLSVPPRTSERAGTAPQPGGGTR